MAAARRQGLDVKHPRPQHAVALILSSQRFLTALSRALAVHAFAEVEFVRYLSGGALRLIHSCQERSGEEKENEKNTLLFEECYGALGNPAQHSALRGNSQRGSSVYGERPKQWGEERI